MENCSCGADVSLSWFVVARVIVRPPSQLIRNIGRTTTRGLLQKWLREIKLALPFDPRRRSPKKTARERFTSIGHPPLITQLSGACYQARLELEMTSKTVPSWPAC